METPSPTVFPLQTKNKTRPPSPQMYGGDSVLKHHSFIGSTVSSHQWESDCTHSSGINATQNPCRLTHNLRGRQWSLHLPGVLRSITFRTHKKHQRASISNHRVVVSFLHRTVLHTRNAPPFDCNLCTTILLGCYCW